MNLDLSLVLRTPGTGSIRATYDGDREYLAKTGPCQTFTVTKAVPTVSTQILDASLQPVTSVTAGDVVHDSGAVRGAVGTPTVTTQVRDATGTAVSAVALGSSAHDFITVTGIPGIAIAGTVTIRLFSDGTCASAAGTPSSPLSLTPGAGATATLDATTFAQA